MTFTGEELRWLSGVILNIYSARTFAELYDTTVKQLNARFRSVLSVCDSASYDGTQYTAHAFVGHTQIRPDSHLYLWDSPTVIRIMEGDQSTVFHLREAGRLDGTDFFNNICRHHGFVDQLSLNIMGPTMITNFSVARDTLFTGRDQFLMSLLHIHVMAALRRVNAHVTQPATSFGHPWLEISAAGQPLHLSTSQHAVLQRYFPNWKVSSRPLPELFSDWIKECRGRLTRGAYTSPLNALLVESARGRLAARYFPSTGKLSGAVRLIETPSAGTAFSSAAYSAFSNKEREVLHWLALGKRDSEIAIILGSAPKTVSKHVEHILRKLNVPNRSAAVLAIPARA